MKLDTVELRVDRRVRESLESVPEPMASAVAEFITGPLLENPGRLGAPLRRELSAYRSVRVGEMRVVCRVADEGRLVRVVRIERRRDTSRLR